MDSRKTSTLPRWREGKTRPATRISGTNGCMPDGAMRRGTCKRTHASAIRAVERLAKALSNKLLTIDVYSSVLAIKHSAAGAEPELLCRAPHSPEELK